METAPFRMSLPALLERKRYRPGTADPSVKPANSRRGTACSDQSVSGAGVEHRGDPGRGEASLPPAPLRSSSDVIVRAAGEAAPGSSHPSRSSREREEGEAMLSKHAPITGTPRRHLSAAMRRAYDQGASIRLLAQISGRSYGSVHRLLIEAGAVMSPRGGSNLNRSGRPTRQIAAAARAFEREVGVLHEGTRR
ncbi:helix-turn-helix domain-containing protein [Streptomyces goshikiensis]|uniref:helix-turn-helix domain-containing protein n=1 Tax=Streptomyces goshikiensis TaxID=1942 RepID=UPI00369862CC